MGGAQHCGGYHEYRGGFILSTVGDVQYCGGYHEYCGGCSVPWGDTILRNLNTMGDIMKHVRGYHEYHGGVQYRGVLK